MRGRGKPGVHEDRCLWTCVRYEYKCLHIADYSDEVLKASNNPFAALMLIAKEMLLQATGTDDEKDNVLFEQKSMADRLLNEKAAVFGDNKIRALKYFLYNYVLFINPKTNRKFIEESTRNSDKNITTMGIVETMHAIMREEGVEEGLEKAIRALLAKRKFSVQEIAELVDVPVALVEKVQKELNGE